MNHQFPFNQKNINLDNNYNNNNKVVMNNKSLKKNNKKVKVNLYKNGNYPMNLIT